MSQPPAQRRHANSQGLTVFGAIIAVIGIIVYLRTAQAATVCSSALVSAFEQQCGAYTTIHTLSLIGIIAGVALVVAGIIVKNAGGKEKTE